MKLPAPKLLLPLALLAAASLGVVALLLTRPSVAPEPPAPVVPLVRVTPVRVEPHRFVVKTHGTVAPRTQTELVPEVAGRVEWVAPALLSGGSFEAGDALLRIEKSDYEVAAEQARAALQRAKSEFDRASSELARRRELASRDIASAAQLEDAESLERVSAAALREARARVERAELDLERTELSAPYAGRVREESVDVGQFVNRGQRLATIYAIDWAEVRLPVPDEELAFLELGALEPGAPASEDAAGPLVTLRAEFAGRPHVWQGRIVRTEGEIDPRSRMVHVVARVEDPYGRAAQDGRTPLAVGLFVEAEIEGNALERAIVLPRTALRGGDRVLVVDAEDRLRFRDVAVARRMGDSIVLSGGVEAAERVVISPLSSVSDGMAVRTQPDVAAGGAS
jgi:RND family efflux transporter MFP subunit